VRRSRVVVALLAFGLLTAGCTTSEAGEASPTQKSQPTATGESSSDTGTPTVDIPPPPRDLSLDGLDPCTLFTAQQRAQLQADDVRPSVAGGTTIYKDMKQCSLDKEAAEPFLGYSVIAVTNVDVSFWLNERRNADAKLISIAGYPAAEFHTKGVEDSDCAVAVGVAKNQHLHVEMEPLSEDLKQDQICQLSEQAAEMALQTLQTLR
jgi:uncharacterized protein DUF3558